MSTNNFAIKHCPLCNNFMRLSYTRETRKYYCPILINDTPHYYIEFGNTGCPIQSIILQDFQLINTYEHSQVYLLNGGKLILTCPTLSYQSPEKLIKKIKLLIPFS